MDVDASLPRETGHRVRDARKRRKLSRRRVATDAGFAVHELASVERGHRPLTIADLRSLAGSIGIEVDDLLPDDCVVEDAPPPDDVRIEDLLRPTDDSYELEVALGSSAYSSTAPEFVERRKVPIASARLNRAFVKLREHTEKVRESCAVLQTADATDDVAALLENLQGTLTALAHDGAYAECLAEYQRAREEYLRSTRWSSRQSWRTRAGRPATGNQLT
jgi:transcriptional regulator with XRE-family HTH domain